MVQMLYQGVNFLGTIKADRKGLQKTSKKDPQRPFVDIKKKLGKDYDPKIGGIQGAQLPSNTKTKKYQGYKKGHFEIRKIKDLSVVVNVQKDNKVMIEGGNSISMTKTAMIQRYDVIKRERESISVWLGHALYNLIYGQVDQATSQRTKAGGHKWKATRWSKSMTHYAMFGVLPTNAFLNMKMANPQDSRTFREFKKSICRQSMIHAPNFPLKERKRKINLQPLIRDKTVLRQRRNQFLCRVKDGRRSKVKMAAARHCGKSGPYRFIRIEDISSCRARVRCKQMDDVNDPETRCNNYAEVACIACGTEFCFDKVIGTKAKKAISHASASHQPEWFYLEGPKMFCLRK